MYPHVSTELYLQDKPASVAAVEHMCSVATRRSPFEALAIAIAVTPPNVARASALLFGTGIGVISALDDADDFVGQARVSVANGATEIALPRLILDQASTLKNLMMFLGSATPVTVDITTNDGAASLDSAEHALGLGVDFVAYMPIPASLNSTAQSANLVALVGAMGLGGVKLAATTEHHLVVLDDNEWARCPGNARVCIPVPARDLRP